MSTSGAAGTSSVVSPSYPVRSPLGNRMSGSSQQSLWKPPTPALPARQALSSSTTANVTRSYPNSSSAFMGGAGGGLMTSTVAGPTTSYAGPATSYTTMTQGGGGSYMLSGDVTPGAAYSRSVASTPVMISSTHRTPTGTLVQSSGGGASYVTRSQTSGGGMYGTTGLQKGSSTTMVSYGEERVISERIVEHEVRVPKRVVREDIVEKVIIVPEKVVHEEVIDDVQMIREKIVEVAKPVYQERIVEVPEYEYVEKLVEVPEVVYQEKVREIPRVEIQERITEVPKIITQERVVEVPEIEYLEVPYEKIVEVPEIREQIVWKQIPVPQYVERPVPEYVNVDVYRDVERNIPIPIEVITTLKLKLPRLRPRYTKHDIPLYVPRFIEIPLPAEMLDASTIASAEHYARQVAVVASHSAASLCEIERLAGTLKELDTHYNSMMVQASETITSSVTSAWQKAAFEFVDDIPIQVRKYTPPTPPIPEEHNDKARELNARSPTLEPETHHAETENRNADEALAAAVAAQSNAVSEDAKATAPQSAVEAAKCQEDAFAVEEEGAEVFYKSRGMLGAAGGPAQEEEPVVQSPASLGPSSAVAAPVETAPPTESVEEDEQEVSKGESKEEEEEVEGEAEVGATEQEEEFGSDEYDTHEEDEA